MSDSRSRLERALRGVTNNVDRKMGFIAWLNDELVLRHASKAILVG